MTVELDLPVTLDIALEVARIEKRELDGGDLVDRKGREDGSKSIPSRLTSISPSSQFFFLLFLSVIKHLQFQPQFCKKEGHLYVSAHVYSHHTHHSLIPSGRTSGIQAV